MNNKRNQKKLLRSSPEDYRGRASIFEEIAMETTKRG